MNAPTPEFPAYDPKGKYRRVDPIARTIRQNLADCRTPTRDELIAEEKAFTVSESFASGFLVKLVKFDAVEQDKLRHSIIDVFGFDIQAWQIVDQSKVLPVNSDRLALARLALAMKHVNWFIANFVRHAAMKITFDLAKHNNWKSSKIFSFFFQTEKSIERQLNGTLWYFKSYISHTLLDHILQVDTTTEKSFIAEGIINSQIKLSGGHSLQRALEEEVKGRRVTPREFFQERLSGQESKSGLVNLLADMTQEEVSKIWINKTQAFDGPNAWMNIPSKIEKIFMHLFSPNASYYALDASSNSWRKEASQNSTWTAVPLHEKNRKPIVTESLEELLALGIQVRSTSDGTSEVEDRLLIKEALDQFSPIIQKTVRLKGENYTDKEIATILGEDVNTIKVRLNRFRKSKIAIKLERDFYG